MGRFEGRRVQLTDSIRRLAGRHGNRLCNRIWEDSARNSLLVERDRRHDLLSKAPARLIPVWHRVLRVDLGVDQGCPRPGGRRLDEGVESACIGFTVAASVVLSVSRACSHLATSVLGPVPAERRNTVLLIYGALYRCREAIALLELLLRSRLCGAGLVFFFSLRLIQFSIGLSHALDVQLERD